MHHKQLASHLTCTFEEKNKKSICHQFVDVRVAGGETENRFAQVSTHGVVSGV